MGDAGAAGQDLAGPVPSHHPTQGAGQAGGPGGSLRRQPAPWGWATPGQAVGPGQWGLGRASLWGAGEQRPGASRGQGPTAAGQADVGAGLTWGPGPHGDRADVGTRPWVVGGSPAGWSGPARPVNALGALTSRLCSVPVGEQMIEWG